MSKYWDYLSSGWPLEVGRSIIGGVVDHRAGARCKSTIHDERNRGFLDLPVCAFWTIDVDVAASTVAERTLNVHFFIDFAARLSRER